MPFVKKTEAREIFIGRTNELDFFIQYILQPEEPNQNIISIWGNAGVGKSTLIARLINEARAFDFKDYCLTAIVDARWVTPTVVMEKFAYLLSISGEFEKELNRYKEVLRKLQTARDASWGGTAIDLVGSTFKGLVQFVPTISEIVGKRAEAPTKFILDEFRKLMEDPIGNLTDAFVKELNNLANTQITLSSQGVKRQRRVLLFFDTFEQLAAEIVPWLLNYFLEAKLSSNIVLVMVGREPIDRFTPDELKWSWSKYQDTIHYIPLNSFTKDETRAYLAKRGITDDARLNTIWRLSQGLPLYLSLLTSNPQGEVDSTADVVANFLRWIPKEEEVKRQLALDAALLSRPFNQDDLATFTYLTENERPAFHRWLIRQPFVLRTKDGRSRYHDLTRELFSRHIYQLSPNEYKNARSAIANYYRQLLEKTLYDSAEWLELALALIYQLFLLPDEVSHIDGIEQVLNAYKHTGQPGEIIKVLRDLSQELQNSQTNTGARQIARQLLRYIEADLADQDEELLAAANDLLEQIAKKPSFSPELLADIYRKRSSTYLALNEYQQSLEDLNRAIKLDPKVVKTYILRGQAYLFLNEYQRAIKDFDRAIKLNPNYAKAYGLRGEAYHLLNDYQQAIKDFGSALKLDPDNVITYIDRGETNYLLNKHWQAIEDFDQAIKLNPIGAPAYYKRGLAYAALRGHRQAIENFDQAIKLDPSYVAAYDALQESRQVIKDVDNATKLTSEQARVLPPPSVLGRETTQTISRGTIMSMNDDKLISPVSSYSTGKPSVIPLPAIHKLTEILAMQAASSFGDPKDFFRDLVDGADLPSQWKLEAAGVWRGNAKRDARALINWGISKGVNPARPQFTTLGSLLEVLLPDVGLDEQKIIASLIVIYQLYLDERLRESLTIRYQIPMVLSFKAEQTTTGLDIAWRGPIPRDELQFQNWLKPEPPMLDVGFLMRAIQHTASVCRIELQQKGRQGTGFLIADNLVLTNYHVLKLDDSEDIDENAYDALLRFGCITAGAGREAEGQTFKLVTSKPIVQLSPMDKLDYVLLQVEDRITQAKDIKKITDYSPQLLSEGMGMHILQHPMGKAMKVSINSNGITAVYRNNSLVQYVTTALVGSSGSPCFNEEWKLVALHHAERATAFGSIREGILFSSIYEEIKSHLS